MNQEDSQVIANMLRAPVENEKNGSLTLSFSPHFY